MDRKRGRPQEMTLKDIETILESHVNEIFVGTTVVSKDSAIWQTLSHESNNIKKPRGFYSHVVGNRGGIKDKLLRKLLGSSLNLRESTVHNNTTTASTILEDSVDENVQIVNISFTRREFEVLLEEKDYNRSDSRNQRVRRYTCFQSGEWQRKVTEKLWLHKVPHGFNFKNHKISFVTNTAFFKGSCKCGSQIEGNAEDITCDIIAFACKITAGNGRSCGKRYCRAPERKVLGEMLAEKNQCVGVYRALRADELMDRNDPEPPYLYSGNVLRGVKAEYKRDGRIHKDPLKALEIMQLGTFRNVIHGTGQNPFFSIYWTHHQLDVWRENCKKGDSRLCLDATGKVVKKIIREDKSESKVIYLYEGVVGTSKGQYSVTQMITEAHNTNSIHHWLAEWHRLGAPFPKEVVCDSSIALLTAAVRAFTGYLTIDKYSAACHGDAMPNCYIRIDVAHFIHMYARFLSECRVRIKKFFLASIGQLILSSNKLQAETLLTLLLTVCRSETEGIKINDGTRGEKNLCEIRKHELLGLLTGSHNADMESMIDSLEDVDDNESEADESTEDDESDYQENPWKLWACRIDKAVQDAVATDIGDRENAHYLPHLADRLVKDLKWFPLWSCVCRNNFGYGREPATSAPVESDFNDLKTRVLKNESLPMRADDFVVKHVNYLSGRLKLSDIPDEKQISQESSPVRHSSAEKSSVDDFFESANHTREDKSSIGQLEIDNALLAHSSFLEEKEKEVSCIACKMGPPGGAHKCFFCHNPVHALPGCSDAIDDNEGYGQKRLCKSCSKNHAESAAVALTSNAMENWRGLAIAKSQSKRLRKEKSIHEEEGEEETKKRRRLTKKTMTSTEPAIESQKMVTEMIAGNRTDVELERKREKIKMQAGQPKKQALYLRPNLTKNQLLLHEKLKKIPILRNGDANHLRAVALNKRKLTLTNTCSFDSIFQLFLTASLDFEQFLESCKTNPNKFMTAVYEAATRGINSVYRARAEILSTFCVVENSNCGVNLLNCRMTMGGICRQLFKDVPSFTEIVKCSGGCSERRVTLALVQIETKHVTNGNDLVKAIENTMQLQRRYCANVSCASEQPVTVTVELGSILIIEVWSENNKRVQLGKIPTELDLAFCAGKYNLAGVVEFISPKMHNRSNNEINAIGHYVAIAHRRDYTWEVYDDTKESKKNAIPKNTALVEIIMYIRG